MIFPEMHARRGMCLPAGTWEPQISGNEQIIINPIRRRSHLLLNRDAAIHL